MIRELRNAFLIVLGILSAGMGLHGFLLSSNFIDGGVTGISMLLEKSVGVPLSILLPLVNLPFIILGWSQLGRSFAIRSMLAIGGLAVALATIHFPDVTPDPLLTAVFGGFFIGAGIGLAVRGGAVLDGTEIAALIISKRSRLMRVGDVILIFNSVLFLAAMELLGIEAALYSILTYVAAARTLDFIIHGIDAYTALTIISDRSSDIRMKLMESFGRGVTTYTGKGGRSGLDQEILFCVVTRLEVGKVTAIVQELDSDAFVAVHSLADVHGGTLKRRLTH